MQIIKENLKNLYTQKILDGMDSTREIADNGESTFDHHHLKLIHQTPQITNICEKMTAPLIENKSTNIRVYEPEYKHKRLGMAIR